MRHTSRTTHPPPRNSSRRFFAALAVLLAVLSGVLVSSAVGAQQDTTNTDNGEVRIVARKLADGRIEFGLQPRAADGAWSDRQLPRVRFFPTTAGIGRWLASSPLTLPAGEVRIVARKLADGRIEFGLQPRSADGAWSDRQLPRVRFFPTTAGIGRWLASSPLTLTPTITDQPSTTQYTAITAGSNHSCALRTDATITCWGSNNHGRADAPTGQYTAITAGRGHSCALRTDGAVTCWGSESTHLPAW